MNEELKNRIEALKQHLLSIDKKHSAEIESLKLCIDNLKKHNKGDAIKMDAKDDQKQLFLMRHGDARSQSGRDADRELTSLGRQEVVENAGYLPAKIDFLACSSLIRAQQTAQLVQEVQGYETSWLMSDLITPQGQSRSVLQWLESQSWQSAR